MTVNGAVATPGTRVDPTTDDIRVDGTPLGTAAARVVLAFHKPAGVVTTMTDPQGRPCVGDVFRNYPGLFHVGRLDEATEGLLLLTNDGDFALRLTHPRYGVRKCYRAIVEGRVEPVMLRRFTSGIEHEGETLKAERARIVDANNSHSIVELELAEGKNREVRRLFESQNLLVERLHGVHGVALQRGLDHADGIQPQFVAGFHRRNHVFLNLIEKGHVY